MAERSGPVSSWATARQRALSRLSQQARLLEADGVLGVGERRRVRDGDPAIAEMVFTGTAVRIKQADPAWRKAPVLGLVSPQEFCVLRRSGVQIAGIAGSYASVEVTTSWDTRRATSRWRWRSASQQLDALTTGVYEARRLAVDRLRSDATALACDGVIGVDLANALETRRESFGRTVLTVHLLGTAVRRQSNGRVAPSVALSMRP